MQIYVAEGGDRAQAEKLADRLGCPILYQSDQSGEPEAADGLLLCYDAQGLTLQGDGLSMQGDFHHMIPRLKPGNLSREFLVKTSKLKNLGEHPIAIDATAGMGEDSLLLAAAGYTVYLYELNPVIAALLQDTVRRAADIPELAPIVARMHVMPGDSIQAMKEDSRTDSIRYMEEVPDSKPDLILLDPMFPARKKSGLIKKKFQLLQRLEQPCSDERELMEAAIQADPRRILVKRPLKGPYLAGCKPDYSIQGKAIRYDCYNVRTR